MSVNLSTPQAQRLQSVLKDVINAQMEWIEEDKYQIKNHRKRYEWFTGNDYQNIADYSQQELLEYRCTLHKDRKILKNLAELQTEVKRQLGNPPKASEVGLVNLMNPLPHDYQMGN